MTTDFSYSVTRSHWHFGCVSSARNLFCDFRGQRLVFQHAENSDHTDIRARLKQDLSWYIRRKRTRPQDKWSFRWRRRTRASGPRMQPRRGLTAGLPFTNLGWEPSADGLRWLEALLGEALHLLTFRSIGRAKRPPAKNGCLQRCSDPTNQTLRTQTLPKWSKKRVA